MTEENSPDPGSQTDQSLIEEFRNLGANLTNVMRSAWDRPERQKLQKELEGGINELGNTLRREAKAVAENPVSQRIKTEVVDIGDRVRSGEIEAKVREELIHALQIVNKELDNVSKILSSSPKSETGDSGAQNQPSPNEHGNHSTSMESSVEQESSPDKLEE